MGKLKELLMENSNIDLIKVVNEFNPVDRLSKQHNITCSYEKMINLFGEPFADNRFKYNYVLHVYPNSANLDNFYPVIISGNPDDGSYSNITWTLYANTSAQAVQVFVSIQHPTSNVSIIKQ